MKKVGRLFLHEVIVNQPIAVLIIVYSISLLSKLPPLLLPAVAADAATVAAAAQKGLRPRNSTVIKGNSASGNCATLGVSQRVNRADCLITFRSPVGRITLTRPRYRSSSQLPAEIIKTYRPYAGNARLRRGRRRLSSPNTPFVCKLRFSRLRGVSGGEWADVEKEDDGLFGNVKSLVCDCDTTIKSALYLSPLTSEISASEILA